MLSLHQNDLCALGEAGVLELFPAWLCHQFTPPFVEPMSSTLLGQSLSGRFRYKTAESR